MKFSALALRASESETIVMAKKARELKAKGEDIIDLSLGEPDFDTPDEIKEAAKKALDEGKTKYPPVAGIPELKKAICQKLKAENKLDYDVDQIVVSNGAKHSIANIMMAMLDPGDEVLLPAPYWVSYRGVTELLGGECKIIKTSIAERFKLTPELLKSSISEKSKVLIFSSPCNPSGEVYSQNELDALAEVLSDYPDLLVVSDEIYEYINFQSESASIAHSPGMKSRTVIVNGASKGFAMTGWRLGYIAAPAELAKKCELIQSQVTSGVNTMTQWAMVHALQMDRSVVHTMRDAFKKRRNFIISELQEIRGVKVLNPEGAFYAFPDVSYYFGKSDSKRSIENADSLAMYLLEDAHVATVSGAPFGNPECIRISYASDMDSIQEAVRRIRTSLDKLK